MSKEDDENLVRKMTPYLSFLEYAKISSLRSKFAEKCFDILQVPPPPETFNRWLYEQVGQYPSRQTTCDPLLKWPQCASQTSVIKRELYAVMPCRMYPFENCSEIDQIINIYQKLQKFSNIWIGKVKKIVAATSTTEQKDDSNCSLLSKLNELSEKLSKLKTQFPARGKKGDFSAIAAEVTRFHSEISTTLAKIFESKVNELCAWLENEGLKITQEVDAAAEEEAHRLKLIESGGEANVKDEEKTEHKEKEQSNECIDIEKKKKRRRTAELTETEEVDEEDLTSKRCSTKSEAGLRTVCKHEGNALHKKTSCAHYVKCDESSRNYVQLKLYEVEHKSQRSKLLDTIVCQKEMAVRLRQLHELTGIKLKENTIEWQSKLTDRMYCLISRYQTLQIKGEGRGFQWGCPDPFMAFLNQKFSCNCECFASPLNCYCTTFFSAFPDVDWPFGSKGSFFDAIHQNKITEGTYQVNPPFQEGVMERMSNALNAALEHAQTHHSSLRFVVVIPDWSDCTCIKNLLHSPFLSGECALLQQDHAFIQRYSLSPWEEPAQPHFIQTGNSHLFLLETEQAVNDCIPSIETSEASVSSSSSDSDSSSATPSSSSTPSATSSDALKLKRAQHWAKVKPGLCSSFAKPK
ncbi:putative phosphorylated CTD-interacting factor 1 [Monocercomonoides exilis]|uniref:putative phosphorylated CTD-interacting factor 1 n=1 Tax=Monocercomonoides exilis TaxID=2049356 RepID=UPI00355A9CFE|nr:putative phosphorylated CTD-interacting factor 1 [Monocercomonoides exilis]|eukprot:MONOS_6860.1-p1 / transcript=MONOS_6860.1 / gene=MONOS_6860 / organism=Monocercomonoides_exilis_PA203 / gene_product=unspecified product / transcript_product=unspecified product / location=Mono_scaffold00224:63688-66299(+) / protein_length=633 / sequence_SO=supercontig / SO=protein_coding / is_pseudo=false